MLCLHIPWDTSLSKFFWCTFKTFNLLAFPSNANVGITFFHCTFELDTSFSSHHSNQQKTIIAYVTTRFDKVSVRTACCWSWSNISAQILMQEKRYHTFPNIQFCFCPSPPPSVYKYRQGKMFSGQYKSSFVMLNFASHLVVEIL